MDTLICNKCFAPIHRGEQPYNITQCAHIFCRRCLQQAEKQCPQCGYDNPISLPLKEPLTPKVVPFFMPLTETVEILLKVEMFRNNQIKITMQRFHDLDKKYEMLKAQYFIVQRNIKVLMDKYSNMKSENENLKKKLLHLQMSGNIPRQASSVIRTPTDSGIFTHPSNTRYSSESLEFLNSTGVMSVQSTESKKQRKSSDGFRIPNNPKVPKSIASLNMLDMNLKCGFMR